MNKCGIPVRLTLVGSRSFGCHGEELDSRADDVLRPGNEARVQAWDKAAAAKSFFFGFVGRGLEVAPQSAVRCHHRWYDDCIFCSSKVVVFGVLGLLPCFDYLLLGICIGLCGVLATDTSIAICDLLHFPSTMLAAMI